MGRLTILHDGAPITDVTPGGAPIYVPGFATTPAERQNAVHGMPGRMLQVRADGVDIGNANPAVVDIVADPERLLVTRGVGEKSHVVTLRAIPPADPYWDDVILHLNADTDLLLDNSPFAHVITSTGAPTRNTSVFRYGTASIDTTTGRLESAACPTFPGLLGANEMTHRWWFRPTALPPNVNSAGFSFADFLFNQIAADGSFAWAGIVQAPGVATVYGITAPAATLVINEWNWICATRTNEAGLAHFELFHGVAGDLTATKIGDSTAFDATWPQANSTMVTDRLVGYDANAGIPIYTNAQWDDFQLTRNINRYRGETAPALPGLLPVMA